MKNTLTFALAFCCIALGVVRSGFAQDNASRTPVSVEAESGTREQDRLDGPVRHVRVETAKIMLKDGKWVEGPRELLGIVTYDPTGKKIDSAAYPAGASTAPGKEQYLYDDKGNIVEMILLGKDGSVLSRESYKYEFDHLGNWTRMSSSVAVFENGKIRFEPTGITYRTISYYYSQAFEKLSAPSTKSNGVSATSTSSTLVPNSNASSTESSQPVTNAAQVSTPNQPVPEAANAHAKKEPVATSSENHTTPDEAPTASVARHVAEDVLRNAAIELPKPEYSAAALLARASGKVKVQILVGANGLVTNAEATSGHPLLGASAEAAARKARFSLTKASPGATRVYGVISYDFVPPAPASEAVSATTPTIERNPPKPADRKPEASPIAERAAFVDSKPKATPTIERSPPKPVDRKPEASPIAERAAFVDSKPKATPTIDRNPPKPVDRKPEASPIAERAAFVDSKPKATPTIDRNPPKPVDRKPEASPIAERAAFVDSKPKATPTIDRNPPKPVDRKPEASPITDRAAFVDSKPRAPANYSEAARSFYEKGLELQASGQHAEAAEAFNEAVRVNPNDANAYERLAMSYSELQKHKEAIVVYKMAVQTNRSALGAQAYYLWGQSYLALEKTSDALKAFKQALYTTRADTVALERKEVKGYPSPEQLHYALGIAYLNGRHFADSINELKQVVTLNRKNADAYYALAVAYLANGNRREAEKQQKILSSLDSALAEKIASALAVYVLPVGCRNIGCR